MIEIQQITKSFENDVVLAGISETIKKGEIFTIIGPSGQGKTTLLRILGLLEKPSSGQILLDGQPICDLPDAHPIRRRIGMVFQNPVVFRETVFDNIALGLRFRGVPEDVIREKVCMKLGEIGLCDYADRMARTLSGGEKQRIALARVLITEPDILILDEPTANLDPLSTQVIEKLIRHYNKEQGTTVILSTHDLMQGQRIADRIAVMMGGRFIQSGTMYEVFTRPTCADVARFIGIGNIFSGRIVRNEEGLSVILAQGVEIYALCDLPKGRDVTVAIRPEEITIHKDQDRGSSARNNISGIIQEIRPSGIISFIMVQAGNLVLSAQVTMRSIKELDLIPGGEVVLSFKASSVHIMPQHDGEDICS